MDFLEDWKTFFIQGLIGMGLVGFNTAKIFINNIQDREVSMDYAEFFPNVAVIENGIIKNQCVRVYKAHHSSGRTFYALVGPQPRSDELSAMFIKKFVNDFRILHDESPIDFYMGFGAFITDVFSIEKQEGSLEYYRSLADQMLDNELNKSRKLYVATCGSLDYDEFAISIQDPEFEVVKEPQGFISGLNGVLPAVVGERFNIPTVTIMIETSSSEQFRYNGAVAQLLGLLASRKGLAFLNKYFDLKLDLGSYLDPIINDLVPIAKKEIVDELSGKGAKKKPPSPDTTFI